MKYRVSFEIELKDKRDLESWMFHEFPNIIPTIEELPPEPVETLESKIKAVLNKYLCHENIDCNLCEAGTFKQRCKQKKLRADIDAILESKRQRALKIMNIYCQKEAENKRGCATCPIDKITDTCMMYSSWTPEQIDAILAIEIK
jgi:hypothetical protein